MVVSKDIGDIPWRQRHGPSLRALIFFCWSYSNEDSLAASLLQMNPEDLPFREMVYAILCLAAGGKNLHVLSSKNVKLNGVFGFIHEGRQHNANSEFVSNLASGAHLQGLLPGSSPEGTVYWLDDILVVLTAQLYRPGAVDEGIAGIVHHCQKNHPTQYVDAVLISVEHVVLVHVTPDGKIQHTAVMPLVNIKNHLSMSASDRYAESYLEKLTGKEDVFMKTEEKKRRKANQERMLKNEGIDIHFGHDDDEEAGLDEEEEESALYATQVDGSITSTFYALVHLFEAAACKHLAPAKTADGSLPNEIYTKIIKQVTDTPTRHSLMKVSRTFRQICQEDLLFAEGVILEPCDACQGCDEAGSIPDSFDMYDVKTGIRSRVHWKRAGGSLGGRGDRLRVAVGAERNKRSVLADVKFRFVQA